MYLFYGLLGHVLLATSIGLLLFFFYLIAIGDRLVILLFAFFVFIAMLCTFSTGIYFRKNCNLLYIKEMTAQGNLIEKCGYFIRMGSEVGARGAATIENQTAYFSIDGKTYFFPKILYGEARESAARLNYNDKVCITYVAQPLSKQSFFLLKVNPVVDNSNGNI